MSELSQTYQSAIEILKKTPPIGRENKINPKDYIVATHGPALTKAVMERPEILDLIGIYRFNCSHLGKESDLSTLAEYLKVIHQHSHILIDLQWPKPRIHETMPGTGGIPVQIGDKFEVCYASGDSEERFCTKGKLRVCFPEIIQVMDIGDTVIFDDGKMTAIVREKSDTKAIIECSEILSGEDAFILGGRKWICVRNKPLGIDCITDHDKKSIEFARSVLGFEYVDNIMVSYFSTPNDIEYFVKIIRDDYEYNGNLWGKFETPYAVYNLDKILNLGYLSLAMLGRGDLRVEMDPRAVINMHDIQTHFFTLCEKSWIESICATGFLESMLTPEGKVTTEEIYDMKESVLTGPDHLMLSGESTYGAQAGTCVELETEIQREMHEKIEKWDAQRKILPKKTLKELLYIKE